LIQSTDRKGQVTRYAYDPQSRLTRIDYPDTTQTRSYDVVGRLTEVRESGSIISYVYDNVDRLVSAITDTAGGRHVVGYEYDTLDRVTKRTLDGTDPTLYTYDNAGRLTIISYRNQVTSYTWDAASRLTAKVLPNAMRQELVYDNADRLLGITYKAANATPIETVSYAYDAKGQRITKTSGTASLRETPFDATYDAANRLTQITVNGEAFVMTYDDNGNLAQKQGAASGITTYTWDSRNRLAQISSPTTMATFEYDGLDRRVGKTVNGSTSQYIYDGAQAIGEIANGQQAALLTGLQLDEVIARYSSTGTKTYLTDALRSVIAQANDQQAVQNFYSYTPYGEARALGSDEGNAVQYTGRENDRSGLYFYRARYYDPVLKRFVSADPMGMAAGPNFYAYVDGNPISLSDPLGLDPWANDPGLKGIPTSDARVQQWLERSRNSPAGPMPYLFDLRRRGIDRYDDNVAAAERYMEMCQGNYEFYPPFTQDDFNDGQYTWKWIRQKLGLPGNGAKDNDFVHDWGRRGIQDRAAKRCGCT
jgi:RHS repeat-associated protein